MPWRAVPGARAAHSLAIGHVSRYTDPEMLELYVAAAAGR